MRAASSLRSEVATRPIGTTLLVMIILLLVSHFYQPRPAVIKGENGAWKSPDLDELSPLQLHKIRNEAGETLRTPKNGRSDSVFNACDRDLTECHKFANIEEVHDQNRCILRRIDSWATAQDLDNGVFHYGLPTHVEHLVVKDVGTKINLSDLVSFLLTKFGPDSNYMEMGVSVGKTLFQVLTTNCAVNVVAFDIERINPTFDRLLAPFLVQSVPEETLAGHDFMSPSYVSQKTDDCVLNRWNGSLRDNKFFYVTCDEFDKVGWRRLESLITSFKSPSFQVVFSDALHTTEAINLELDQIFLHQLLNRESFAYVWDDMGADVPPFCERLVNYAAPHVRTRISCVIGKLPGWFGINEPDHMIALITTLDIHELVVKHWASSKFIRRGKF